MFSELLWLCTLCARLWLLLEWFISSKLDEDEPFWRLSGPWGVRLPYELGTYEPGVSKRATLKLVRFLGKVVDSMFVYKKEKREQINQKAEWNFISVCNKKNIK